MTWKESTGFDLLSSMIQIMTTGIFNETIIAFISAFFCRYTVKSHKHESITTRLLFSFLLGILAYTSQPYDIQFAFQLYSYLAPRVIIEVFSQNVESKSISTWNYQKNIMLISKLVSCAIGSIFICRFILSYSGISFLWNTIIPTPIVQFILYLFPISDLSNAYDIITKFTHEGEMNKHLSHLLFVTWNIQIGIGYLGIDFLRSEQIRKNQLVRMEIVSEEDGVDTKTKNDKTKRENLLKKAKKFRHEAAPFILFTVIPYMLQIIILGNINRYSFACFRDEMHKAVRLNELFDHDSHLVAMSKASAVSPGVYASSLEEVVNTSYDLVNRKLFSVPKLMLLPQVVIKEPLLLVKIFPLIFFADFLKGRMVAWLSNKIENLKKEEKDLAAIRTKIEAFDMKNADLLQRSGFKATEFTKRRWSDITEQIQAKHLTGELLKRTRGFFEWLQRNFIFASLIDCALANLIAVGRIVSADIFVFSRAIEDTVDLFLMKSRAESELTSMATEIDRLHELVKTWDQSKDRNLVHCAIIGNETKSNDDAILNIENLEYSRGTALVRVNSLKLPAGVYAITGANGSGKSSLFRVLMSCESNDKSIDLPESIILGHNPQCPTDKADDNVEHVCVSEDNSETKPFSITMPSSDVVEISQNFYWPLYTKPIDWIYQSHISELDDKTRQDMVMKVVTELKSLLFTRDVSNQKTENNTNQVTNNEALPVLSDELLEEKEDWFNDLSGGQKCKMELVRKVFLKDKCPDVLLIDETMAPLDPISKSLVMSKLKNFCKDSILLVIYHRDVSPEDGDEEDCVPSSNFFDYNLHVENGYLIERNVC